MTTSSAIRDLFSNDAVGDPPLDDHLVQFYENEDFLSDVVVTFLGTGMAAGEPAVVIATEAHRRVFAERLASTGLDVAEACRSGQLTLLDARATLERFMVDGSPDRERFGEVVGSIIENRVRACSPIPVRAYGEMVDLLLRDGNPKAAIALEEMWNALQRQQPFKLLCAYVMGGFYKEADGLHEICKAHGSVLALGPDDVISVNDQHAPTNPFTQDHARRREEAKAFRGSFRELRRAEQELRDRQRERHAGIKRTERLTIIMAAIADAVTADQVFEAVVDQVAQAVEASSAALWIADEAEGTVMLVRAVGYEDTAKQKLATTRLDTPYGFPAIDAIRRAEPIFIASQEELLNRYPHLASLVSSGRSYRIAALPVVIQGRHLGSLTFTFDNAPPIDHEQRSFLMLVARYSGQALERLRMVEENQHARRRAELLYKLVGGVVDASSLDEVFTAALDAIGTALHTMRSAILVFDAPGVMRFCAWRGLSDGYRQAVEGHSPWARDARAPEPIIVTNVETDPAMTSYLPVFRAEGIAALGFIPLVAGGRLVGKFMVYYDRPRHISAHELELARAIANHVAAAIGRFSAVQELEKTVRFNEMFTAILGHDLRNPLGAIIATADMALRRAENDRVSKPLTRIIVSGQRMARMIDQLLDFTRARLGTGIPLHRKQLDVVQLLRQVLDELAVLHPGWAFRLQHAGDTHGGWDDDRLCQVFSNLLGNAVEHGSREHGIDVHIDGTAADGICIHVHNMGFVPAELVSRLFDPMTGGERRREKSNGLGLGLFITQQIARAHGGRVDVVSSETEGTTFTVLLPRGSLGAEKGA